MNGDPLRGITTPLCTTKANPGVPHMNAITSIQSVVPVETEQTLIEGIKLNHQEVRAAETSAAVFAWHAGQQAQRLIDRFGWSERKLVEATGIARTTLQRYLRVARRRASAAAIGFGESISSIIDEDVPSVREKKNRAATFGTAEAEYAIKLHRMAESSSPAEAEIATRKLEQFASDHGMAGEEIIERSRKALGLTEDFQNPEDLMGPVELATMKMLAPYKAMPKEKLLDVLLFAIMTHPSLIRELKEQFL